MLTHGCSSLRSSERNIVVNSYLPVGDPPICTMEQSTELELNTIDQLFLTVEYKIADCHSGRLIKIE
jgi:hypothetical protein